ncbi:MRPL19 (YNL185C) [Zygosaccharomyces parabailii]|uniref:Large ribosomal subunit protein uL11m n=1 Tax=Zygosaccharomyces bailii (strain CLIB 213 / ATCC 58445 / CBS 680 / BCRC 21525 / NBRC 1098 / NCYC 1416 / NRRL Y-2227) TaxID=1333698 RepID=A0A8J2X7T6_ZYGB2|nr:MRPL19 (YNL185C) [Zygosaccharomyces parabailii]CDF89333.1 ZYBA0S04-01728g1_1 [Zygosaccharomyces bailii CLIB 213]CDH08291.1 probable 54S ribosomal protein L19,mitochondrial [Zygosaccharomyces bailii ISA1307]SJM85703.1 probable 54S ribosomal protein L19, mitochondrial [Zygosaccharomyces bailii]
MSQPVKNLMVKLIVGAGQAAPSPPVGPALGSKGIKAMDFCKEFNARTSGYQPGVPIPVLITIKPDRTFSFEMKSPPTGYLLLKALGVEKGHGQPNVNMPDRTIGELSLKHIYEIAKVKKTDGKHAMLEMESIVKSVIGVAKSMGIKVVP